MCVEVQGCGSELQDPADEGESRLEPKVAARLPALMRVSVRNWDFNGRDNDPT